MESAPYRSTIDVTDRMKESTMELHPDLMTELVRQRQLELFADAKRTPRALRSRRSKRRHGDE
jgi:hypothetical protein